MATETTVQQANQALIEEYFKFKANKMNKYHQYIIQYFAEEAEKLLTECDELYLTKFLESHCGTGGSWNTNLSVIRGLYKWILNRNSRIPVSKWKPPAFFGLIVWKDGDSKKYSQSDMWTEEDILLAVQTCAHPRDKAVIALGYDVAGRPVAESG